MYEFRFRDIRRRKPEALINWALDKPVKSPAARLVLVEMVRQCDSPFLEIDFSNKAAARTLNMSVKTVRRAITELEDLDLISSRGMSQNNLRQWRIEADEV